MSAMPLRQSLGFVHRREVQFLVLQDNLPAIWISKARKSENV
jgi:hypothetical protein